jgi:DNA-binding IclR family transcriptional regulator
MRQELLLANYKPLTMPKPKAKEIQRRVATIYAVSYLASRPYRATELAKVLGLNLRTTYRILSDLKASNWLVQENCKYSIQPNQTPTQNH